ncbi:MAG: DUF1599 domain-containing protein [Candidatus Nomurabacteria bacterium]|nr:DUF1599 domain-containing protein [Candidatus Nomurabacteria bacterium]
MKKKSTGKKDKTNNKPTIFWFDEITKNCLDIIDTKKKEYGSSVCKYRPSSITDRILTKLSRIRSIQEKGVSLVDEEIEETLTHTINYVFFRIWRLEETKNVREINIIKINKIVKEIKSILEKKNHDYGESWRKMRISSIVDESIVKTCRIVAMEKMIKKNPKLKEKLNPKILDSLFDITNYLVFALIHIKEGVDPMQ